MNGKKKAKAGRKEVTMKAAARTRAPRRKVDPVRVDMITSLETLVKICKYAEITQASTSGLLMMIKREDLVPTHLRRNLDLSDVHGMKVMIRIADMNLEIAGTITRTKFKGKQGFELAIDYSDDAPEYWRECLLDLLPHPGEFDGH